MGSFIPESSNRYQKKLSIGKKRGREGSEPPRKRDTPSGPFLYGGILRGESVILLGSPEKEDVSYYRRVKGAP